MSSPRFFRVLPVSMVVACAVSWVAPGAWAQGAGAPSPGNPPQPSTAPAAPAAAPTVVPVPATAAPVAAAGVAPPPVVFAVPAPAGRRPWTLVMHGGSGAITRAQMTPENEARFRAGIERALAAGQEVLSQGRTSLEAVVAAVKVMEDDPQFNAGRGAVFTNAGRNELDASVMDGDTGQAGAVAGVTVVKNPIEAAVAVMRRTRHVLLSGAGADEFARQSGLEIVDPSYFHTPHRWEQLQRARERDRIELDHDAARRRTSERPASGKILAEGIVDDKFGTVGAVAIDAQGRLAAATSTGGLTNKLFGRVGDSPIVGAGTFADKTVAVSSTGTGEFFIRGAVAHDVSARLRYLRVPLGEAVGGTLQITLSDRGGRGGVIALDAQGNVVMGVNTEGMYRGYRREGGESVVQIYRD